MYRFVVFYSSGLINISKQMERNKYAMYRNKIKRVIAIVMSLCGIICLSWLYLLIVIAIKIFSSEKNKKNGDF